MAWGGEGDGGTRQFSLDIFQKKKGSVLCERLLCKRRSDWYIVSVFVFNSKLPLLFT